MCSSKRILGNNSSYWGKVRKIWSDYLNTHGSVSLRNKIDNKMLHENLISLSNDYLAKKVTDAEIDGRIQAEINRFIGHEEKATAAAH